MNINEINKQNWIIFKDNLKINEMPISSIGILEQECGFDRLRVGVQDANNPEIRVSCTDQNMITELSKSEFFTLSDVTVSKHERNKGFILSLMGYLDPRGLTIRKKIPIFTEEEKQIRSQRAKDNFTKK